MATGLANETTFTVRRLNVAVPQVRGFQRSYEAAVPDVIAHDLAVIPTPRALEAEGDAFRPFRTVVARYCWRAVEPWHRGGVRGAGTDVTAVAAPGRAG